MASGEYSTYGGGALRLKGTKVKKHNKKKKDKESGLEKALSTGESSSRPDDDRLEEARQDKEDGDGKETRSRGRSYGGEKSEGEGGDAPVTYKTESERRFAEARRKKVRPPARKKFPCPFPCC